MAIDTTSLADAESGTDTFGFGSVVAGVLSPLEDCCPAAARLLGRAAAFSAARRRPSGLLPRPPAAARASWPRPPSSRRPRPAYGPPRPAWPAAPLLLSRAALSRLLCRRAPSRWRPAAARPSPWPSSAWAAESLLVLELLGQLGLAGLDGVTIGRHVGHELRVLLTEELHQVEPVDEVGERRGAHEGLEGVEFSGLVDLDQADREPARRVFVVGLRPSARSSWVFAAASLVSASLAFA